MNKILLQRMIKLAEEAKHDPNYWIDTEGKPTKLFRVYAGNTGAVLGSLGGYGLSRALGFKGALPGAASTALGWWLGRSLGTFAPEIDSVYGGKKAFPKYNVKDFTIWDYLAGMVT